MEKEYNVYSEFDIEKHKQKFINYLEVVIMPSGKVCYAVPSHQEFLINYICKEWNVSREKLCELIPEQYKYDFMNWLMIVSGCVCVWTNFHKGECNYKQYAKIEELKKNELLKEKKEC